MDVANRVHLFFLYLRVDPRGTRRIGMEGNEGKKCMKVISRHFA